MPDGKDYADGGLRAIDPGVVGLSQAARVLSQQSERRSECVDFSKVQVLSIGTGESTHNLAPPGSDAGPLFWSKHVAEVTSISQVQGTQLPLSIVLGDRYHHVNVTLEGASWTLDDLDAVQPLFEAGHRRGAELLEQFAPQLFCSEAHRSARMAWSMIPVDRDLFESNAV